MVKILLWARDCGHQGSKGRSNGSSGGLLSDLSVKEWGHRVSGLRLQNRAGPFQHIDLLFPNISATC